MKDKENKKECVKKKAKAKREVEMDQISICIYLNKLLFSLSHCTHRMFELN